MWHLSVDILKMCFWSRAKFYMNHAWHTQNKNIFMTLIWLPNWSMTFTPCMLCLVFCGRMTPVTAFRVLLYLEGDMVSSDDPSQYKKNELPPLWAIVLHELPQCLSSVLYNRDFLICAMTEHSRGSLISWTLRIGSFFRSQPGSPHLSSSSPCAYGSALCQKAMHSFKETQDLEPGRPHF